MEDQGSAYMVVGSSDRTRGRHSVEATSLASLSSRRVLLGLSLSRLNNCTCTWHALAQGDAPVISA